MVKKLQDRLLGIVYGAIEVLVGLNLAPTINTAAAAAAVNSSGIATFLYSLVPIFWPIAVFAAAAGTVYLASAK